MNKPLLSLFLALPIYAAAQTNYDFNKLQREPLDRGLVAFRSTQDSVTLSWRYLNTDPMDIAFDVLRDGRKIAHIPANAGTTYRDANNANRDTRYEIRPVCKDKAAKKLAGTWKLQAGSPIGYLNIPLQKPASVNEPGGMRYGYSANDASMADLDGDGQMEIVLKWDPSNSHDNSHSGFTGPTIIDAYKLDGTHLWRIDLGRNIRSGAHYTQFMVYDLDGDRRAEVVMKTADGTTDGTGYVIGDANADNRVKMDENRRSGYIRGGAEYLTVFRGTDGKAIHTIDYVPAQGNMQDWGDNYANRSERYLACVAYLDGQHPSVVMCRGYYTRMTLAAFDFDGKELHQRWFFDSNTEGRAYHGQGNHNLRVGDVDGDGRDEIVYGSCCIDDNGHGLWSTRMGHGDAMHMTGFLPLDDHLYVWDCHENKKDGSELHDATTGRILFQVPDNEDVGRCMAADVDPTQPGLEMWSSRSGGIRNYKGEVIDAQARIPMNFAVWWDGDLTREMLDHETISKYNPDTHNCTTLLHMDGTRFNNGTKSNPCLAADIIGDWREEVLVRTEQSDALRLYISPSASPYRFHTFLQDPVYRISVTTQNVAYNQPTQVGFYFGAELQGSGRLFRGWQFSK